MVTAAGSSRSEGLCEVVSSSDPRAGHDGDEIRDWSGVSGIKQ